MSREWINWLWIGVFVLAWGAYSMVTFRHFVMGKKSIGLVPGLISGLFFIALVAAVVLTFFYSLFYLALGNID